MQIRRFHCFLPVVLIIVVPAYSFTQSTNLNGYNLQYLRPTSDGRELVVVAGSATLGHLLPQIAFFLNGSRGHLGATDAQNNRIDNIVDTLLTGDLLFGLGLMDFIQQDSFAWD